MGLGSANWKNDLSKKATLNYHNASTSLHDLVYGDQSKSNQPFNDTFIKEDDDDMDLLNFKKQITKRNKQTKTLIDDQEDYTRVQYEPDHITNDWDDAEFRETIRNKFVTGDWSTRRSAKKPSDGDDPSSDPNDENDQEAEEEEEEGMDEKGFVDLEQTESDQLRQLKILKKQSFDQDFDTKQDEQDEEQDEESSITPFMSVENMIKAQRADDPQTILNKTEFASLSQQEREQIEGFAPGTYVRVLLYSFPCEFMQNANYKSPIICGALHSEESRMGFIKIRLKRHRWFPRTLKNRDPLVFSIGWRRFQSIPTYCVQDANNRHRMVKYTPEHMHCIACIWGPFVPQNTGVVAFQSLADGISNFRISATGYTMEMDRDFNIVKKLKLTGTPYKILKNTAFITGMFNSELEVSKFEGAQLRTVSGIRGQVKRIVKTQARSGDFRATFEDKLLKSDIVFLRTWYPIELTKLYNPVFNHLSTSWCGMRTVGQLRKIYSIPNDAINNRDSMMVDRASAPRSSVGHDLVFIPKPNLLKTLPFQEQHKKVVEQTGLTDDLSQYLNEENAGLTELTTALLSDREVKRVNELRKLKAIDEDRKKTIRMEELKSKMKEMKNSVKDVREDKKKKNENRKRKYIKDELNRVKRARYMPADSK
ncbi:ribosome biogenesis protein BMS1 [Acrasis kona]|uniref:Ribosome biogenesis protein BMS1 n=1 Tax=Acrasis kona TaxID=1008807 RepID=A0AAW2YP91_9EUKA